MVPRALEALPVKVVAATSLLGPGLRRRPLSAGCRDSVQV